MALAERWRHHKRRALAGEAQSHPFYCEIRQYGWENFTVEALDTVEGLMPALLREKERIAECPPELRLNLSPGGMDDARFGARRFWDRMNQNPDEKAMYLKKLSDIKKAADWSDYEKMSRKAAAWRAQNPREAYKLFYRARRIAMRDKSPVLQPAQESQAARKHRLMWKYKRAEMCRIHATRMWEERSQGDKDAIAGKMSAAQKARMAAIDDPAVRRAMTQKARDAIDREHQAKCASRGQKRFWEELRRDPARYREYMDRRSKTCSETMKRKYAAMTIAERAARAEKSREKRGLDKCEPTT